jgi:hypothetical protein
MTVNEKRQATNLVSLGPIGEVVLTSFSRIPLEQISQTVYIQPELVDTGAQDDEGGANEPPPKELPEGLQKARKSRPAQKASFWTEPERKSKLWQSFDRRLAMQERQFVPLVKKYLREQAVRIKQRLADGVAPIATVDVMAETKAYADRFFPHYKRAFKYAGQAGYDATQGKLWEPVEEEKAGEGGFQIDPEMLRKLRAQIEKSARYFNETTGKFVKFFVEDAVVENFTTEQLTQELWKALDGRAAWEARRIAATEMTRTDGWGAVEGYKQNPEIEFKGWNCQMLDTSRDDHIEADGQEVPLYEEDGSDGLFHVGGYPMDAPGDGEHGAPAGELCNCRCSTYPVTGAL